MKLVVYFTITRNTMHAAQNLGMKLDCDLFEIRPLDPYTEKDLDWENPKSRASQEMKNPAARPGMISTVPEIEKYDEIYIGFPIWWDMAPRIINTFLESHDLRNKKLYLFATSGGSNIENAARELKHAYPDLDFEAAVLVSSPDSIQQLL